MTLYLYHSINEQLKILKGIIKATSEPDPEGVFEGVFLTLKFDESKFEMGDRKCKFKENDEGYAITKLLDPSIILKEIL